MKATIIFIAVLFFVSNRALGQARTIQGRVISEYLEPLPGVRIQNKDTVLLGTTGIDGRFKIDIPQNTQILLLSSIGFEWSAIKLNSDCDTLEIVMMYSVTYDFMSSRKIDRLRLERFNKLTERHLQAYQRGLFTKEQVCYSEEFEAHKPRIDEIEREMIKKDRQTKSFFERLNIGDTLKIPFSGQYRYDGTDRTTIFAYSIFANKLDDDCIISCIIIGKNKRKKGYNLICKVVNCNKCKSPSIFNGRVVQIGEVFTYNMKYFKILDE